MRILIANANRAVVGGAEAYLRALLPAVTSRGHEIGLLVERQTAPGAELIDASRDVRHVWNGAAKVQDAIDWRPDVAFVHGLESPVLEKRLVSTMPAALFAHSYYGTCPTGTKRHAFPATQFCERRLGPMCLVLHYPRRCGGLDPRTMFADYRRQHARRALLGMYQAVLVASNHMASEYRRHGVPSHGLHVAPLPPTGIEIASAPQSVTNPDRVVFAGRLTDLKGVDLLLHAIPLAARRLGRPLTLRIVGDGPERARLEGLARELKVQAAFIGWSPRELRNAELRAAHLAVMPSTWPEPWGLSGLEAAAAGIPTVAYAAGGIQEWLAHGESGVLAPADPPTAHGLAEAIASALGDDETYSCLARGAWQRAQSYSMDAHVTRVIDVLRDVSA